MLTISNNSITFKLIYITSVNFPGNFSMKFTLNFALTGTYSIQQNCLNVLQLEVCIKNVNEQTIGVF